MDIYKITLPICWYARIFGLCPLNESKMSKFSWFSKSSFWSFLMFPSFLLYFTTINKCPLLDILFIIIPMYASNFVFIGLPKLIEKAATCCHPTGHGFGWLALAGFTVLPQVPLYCFGILKGGFVTFFWHLVSSSTVRINAIMYVLFLFEIDKSFRYFEQNLRNLRGIRIVHSESLESYRMSLWNILSCLNDFQKHYEPIVVLIFCIIGSKLLINIFLLVWKDGVVDWAEISVMVPFIPLIWMASHFRNNILLTINDITDHLLSTLAHKNDDWARKQITDMKVIYFVKMINDISYDHYVIINNTFLSSFIGVLTTYLIAVVQLLPLLGQLVNTHFKDCFT